MSRNILIHHIIVIWDECDHISIKHSSSLSSLFWKGYLSTFPEGAKTHESPAIMATASPMFSLQKIKKFLHKGNFLDYAGENKDLAIAKYCSNGFVDQNEIYHFVIDDMRRMRFKKGDPAMHSDDAVMIVFFTSDRAKGMTKAIQTVLKSPNRANFSFLQVDKSIMSGDDRIKNAGIIFGHELKKYFVQIKNTGLLLKIPT